MELQNKFEVLLEEHTYNDTLKWTKEYTAKECTILCLEEQVKLLARLGSNTQDTFNIFEELSDLQQQLKLLKGEI